MGKTMRITRVQYRCAAMSARRLRRVPVRGGRHPFSPAPPARRIPSRRASQDAGRGMGMPRPASLRTAWTTRDTPGFAVVESGMAE